jgi:aspartate/methionine/tyrosine aminotransferase
MNYRRMPIEIESPEQLGYSSIRFNLAESSVTDVLWDDLNLDLSGLVLQYGDHLGHPGLRTLLAAEANLKPHNVLLTVGAASALFMIHTVLLKAGDECIVTFPNYGTNLETPKAIGCDLKPLELRFEEGWALNFARLEALVSSRTKLISLTTPHNPTGVVLSQAELEQVFALAAKVGAYVLVDETYRDMRFDAPVPMAASLAPHVISVSSVSKTFGLPGLRQGWLITQDTVLLEKLLAAKEQIFIGGSILDEAVTFQVLQQKTVLLEQTKLHIQTNLDAVKSFMKVHSKHLQWVEPGGGVVCLPRLSEQINLDVFYAALQAHGTYVGRGGWFDLPDRYFRLGYGWTNLETLLKGLDSLGLALETSQRGLSIF